MDRFELTKGELIAQIKTIYPEMDRKDSSLFCTFATMKDLQSDQGDPLSQYMEYQKNGKWPLGFNKKLKVNDKDSFNEVQRILSGYSEEEFLRLFLPTFVIDVSEAICLANLVSTKLCVHYLIFYNVKRVLYKYQAEASSQIIKKKEAIYKEFLSLWEKVNPYAHVDLEAFWNLYAAVGYYSLNPQERKIEENAAKAIRKWIEIGESEEHIYEYATRFYCKKEQPEELSERYLNYENDTSERKKVFRSAIRSLSKIPPVEFLRAMEHREKNDIPLENGLVFSRFISNHVLYQKERKAILVRPSMSFLKKWIKETYKYGVATTVVVESDDHKKLLLHTYQDSRYMRVTAEHTAILTADEWKAVCESGTGGEFEVALVFATHTPRPELWQTMRHLWWHTNDQISILETDANLDKDSIYKTIPEHQQLYTVELLPVGIANSTKPSKKVLLTYKKIQTNSMQQTRKVELISYFLNSTAWVEQKMYRDMLYAPVEIDSESFGKTRKTLRTYYNEEIYQRKEHKEERGRALSYQFSPEITIYYNVSGVEKKRASAYLYESLVSEKKGMHSKRKPETIRFFNTTEEMDIDRWIKQEYMFSGPKKRQKEGAGKSIREIVSGWRETIYKETAISLKTLWYVYPELMDQYSEREYETLQKIACSELGWIDMGTVTSQSLDSAIKETFPKLTDIMTRHYWRLVLRLIQFGVKKGHYLAGTIRCIAESESGRNYFSEVREALAKKTFTRTEMKRLLELIEQKASKREDSVHLGIQIKLVLGLENNLVCGLKWADFDRHSSLGFYFLRIPRQVTNDGKQLKGFENAEDYRIVPCPDYLATKLLIEKERVLEKYSASNPNRAIRNEFIVACAEESKSKEWVCGIAPQKLSRECRDLIAQMGFKKFQIEIPDDKRGTKESNMAYYKGDIFRENFRAYMAEEMGMTTGEMAYLLGNQAEVTYEKFYCDYQNEFSLLQMYLKLQRWAVKFELHEDLPQRKKWKETTAIDLSFASSREEKVVDIDICAKEDSEVQIKLNSSYGLELNKTVFEEV